MTRRTSPRRNAASDVSPSGPTRVATSAGGDFGLGGFNGSQDVPSSHRVGLAFLAQDKTTHRSLQQLDTEAIFQSRNDFGNRGWRQASLLGHGGKAAEIDDPDEDGDVVGCGHGPIRSR